MYDKADQVTRVYYDALNPNTTPSGQSRRVDYAHDLAGNRTRVTDNGPDAASGAGVATTYTANVLNQYTQVSGFTAQVSYDGNGNLTALGNAQYAYDAQNRMVSATVGTNMVQSFYDARNRCVARRQYTLTADLWSLTSSSALLYDGWNLIEELDSSGAPTAYVHGPRTDELVAKITSTNTVYYHADVLGNVTHLTDDSGNMVEQYRYDIFGIPTILSPASSLLSASAYGNRFLFTGREWLAELGLYDYRNRMYSPVLGRFMQPDPLGFLAGDVNIYRYCGNDPVNSTDAWGLCTDGSKKPDNPQKPQPPKPPAPPSPSKPPEPHRPPDSQKKPSIIPSWVSTDPPGVKVSLSQNTDLVVGPISSETGKPGFAGASTVPYVGVLHRF
jgi:RHS repeat-associated protein